ncbi:hypothetical protein CD30_10645 [Ureibacillus massiliensis 4400831 = CIP 108448 = CCUG 49529]|uniref:Uncharacterized protein n=1 Tax=Ureibacillus massiliensis 4400831 = CIP 108448 = CCUG 49529 TaxID=1211035 RepID=A0A0A3J121_9BACL|nr:hypothetical protein [Ureibacillus massiliensis]KGR90651.1 hypothetical protein CD30_10645 [Ureibacillus massiliensis 4400831 = CIP 108448 = CCUG 49529]RKJ59794.1 hypothetical protein D7X33_28940 [Butyricicoccus sp. 1XD8-22]
MKASRVSATTSSIFRNSRQYLHTNEQVFRLMEENEGNRKRHNQHQGRSKRDNEKKNDQKRVLRKNDQKLIVKGIQSDAHAVVDIQNSFLQRSAKLNKMTKKRRIHTYRTSI